MENNTSIVSDATFQASPTKDAEYSGFGKHDYVVNGEITVTITLAEYRALVSDRAKAAENDAIMRRIEVERERNALKKELESASAKLAEFQKLFVTAAAKKEDKTNE